MSKPKSLLLDWHLGLGDAILCQGLVRTLCEDRDFVVTLPAWKHNVGSVREIYLDLFNLGLVRIIPVDSGGAVPISELMRGETMHLGYSAAGFDPKRWDESFYKQARVPFIYKWEKFKLGNIEWDELPLPGSFRFVHDDRERGFNIPLHGNDILRPIQKAMNHHAYDIRSASEIHCINSCFAILADLMAVKGRKALWRCARLDGGALPIFGQHWEVID